MRRGERPSRHAGIRLPVVVTTIIAESCGLSGQRQHGQRDIDFRKERNSLEQNKIRIIGFGTIKPVHVTRKDTKDDRIFLRSKEANIFSSGKTLGEAKKEFSEILDFAWNEYVPCDERELHESSIPYKKWLMEHFEKVDHDGYVSIILSVEHNPPS